MATSSILGGERPPIRPKGTDSDNLGPSDSSDSGSDAAGTGDRATAEAGLEEPTNADVLPDRSGVLPDAAQDVLTSADDPDPASAEALVDEASPDADDNEDGEKT